MLAESMQNAIENVEHLAVPAPILVPFWLSFALLLQDAFGTYCPAAMKSLRPALGTLGERADQVCTTTL